MCMILCWGKFLPGLAASKKIEYIYVAKNYFYYYAISIVSSAVLSEPEVHYSVTGTFVMSAL